VVLLPALDETHSVPSKHFVTNPDLVRA